MVEVTDSQGCRNVRTPGNETVRVDTEGSVREDDQPVAPSTAAIGTAVGAIMVHCGGRRGLYRCSSRAAPELVSLRPGREDLELTTVRIHYKGGGPR